MRPRTHTAATALLIPLTLCLPAPAQAAAPHCAPADGRDFPITTRIRGGPEAYQAGGGHGTWSIDLTNTTARPCTGIHPVVVLVDERRQLRAEQPRLEFYDGTRPRPRPVRFEETDQDELVGAFDDGFPGFTVQPGRTVTVKVRLGLTSDAVPNEVTANASVVHRRADDGDWVGQSNDYRFSVLTGRAPSATPPPTGTESSPAPTREGRLPTAEELARTGRPLAALAALTAALLLTGAALLTLGRRRR
ncbi:hypothetical protein [Streptomyces sp. NPDC057877]|uniref:hypothetical protein n=1 Tax=Streptomyces sp. NPDC057877 TaxID=3346269 RepID=UPI00367D24B9